MPPAAESDSVLDRIKRELDRSRLRTSNGLRILAGQARPEVGCSPRQLVWSRDRVRLYRYASDHRRHPVPVLLAMSLVSRSYVFDLRPGNSFVTALLDRGFDVFVIDWGIPDAVDAENSLETYCLDYLPRAANAVLQTSGAAELTLYGYCLGGVLSLLAAAASPSMPLHALVLMTTPIDFSAMGGLVAHLREGRVEPEDLLDETGNLSPSVMAAGLRTFAPLGDVSNNLSLLINLADPRYIEAHATLIGWTRDHIPFPGRTMQQIVEYFIRDDRLLGNRVELDGRWADISTITCPVLKVTGHADHLVPTASSSPLPTLLPQTHELAVSSGHVGLIVGRTAHTTYIPQIADWMESPS